MTALVQRRPEGLYCPAADAWIDPWRQVPRAIITHAHGDHARVGMGRYWAARPAEALMRLRVGRAADITLVDYGQPFWLGDARISLHPAGHILGSAQVRIEVAGEVWVVSGDYKRCFDPTCAPFEPVPCDTFITEATFALPVYRWRPAIEVAQEIWDWWQGAKAAGQTAVLFCYALGKAQRVLAELQGFTDETVLLHGAMGPLVQAYRDAGIAMLPTAPIGSPPRGTAFDGRLVLAPPSAAGTPWMRRFTPYTTGFVSGWMRLRGARRRKGYDRGFVMSDHADWPGLLRSIEQSGARRVLATHGNSDALVQYLRERGIAADALETAFQGDDDLSETLTV